MRRFTITIYYKIALLSCLFLLSCGKESRTERILKNSGAWTITSSSWHYLADDYGVITDTSGYSLLPGSFHFNKKNSGSWTCHADDVFGWSSNGSKFEWHVEKENIIIYLKAVEPGISGTPDYTTTTSFTGQLGEEVLHLEGYWKRDFSVGNYFILFVSFNLISG